MHISKRKFEIVIAEIVTWQEINCTKNPPLLFQEVVIMIPETCAHKLLWKKKISQCLAKIKEYEKISKNAILKCISYLLQ